MIPASRNFPQKQRGLALVIVLWVIVLLSVIATAHSSNVHTTTRLAARQLEFAQLQATANSGVQRAILELLSSGSLDPWPVNGDVRKVTINDETVSVAIRTSTGLLDLNSATPRLLSALLDVSGADTDSKAALVDAILDWRDTDDLTRLHGAEEDDYPSRQSGWTIRNGPFLAVDELRYVLGMTNQYFQHIAPLVTVYSGHPGVNLEFAPAELVRALTGERVNSVDDTLPGNPRSTPAQAVRAGTFHIYAEASSETAIAAIEVVVRVAPTDDRPYTVLAWHEPGRSLPQTAQ